jgi:hypothetical protein
LVVPDILGNNIILDGTLSPEEWNQASSYDLEYEVMPSRNTPAALKTTAYMLNTIKSIYILGLRHLEIQIKSEQP